MPTLIHLADERDSKKIFKAGITIGKGRNGIYCMPVLQNFYVSHQWLRELKRCGTKTFVAVYFKIPSDEMVYAGKYWKQHKHLTLGIAIKKIMIMEDPLGYELIITRKIEAKEINKIKSLPQTTGWRYKLGSHASKPCPCDFCQKGKIKGRKMKNRMDNEDRNTEADIL